MDALLNFAISSVATAPSPASSGTSLVLQSGEGARFPAGGFPVTIWPAGVAPTPANAEIAFCTTRATDTLSLIRAVETSWGGPSARTVVVGDQVAATFTAANIGLLGSVSTFGGLGLRTHPDNDKAANQVAVTALDYVVMDDGCRYSGFSAAQIAALTADVTASGLGGLDTGSRTASTWLSVWLVGKKRTKDIADVGALLHREKDWTVDQSMTTAPDTDLSLRRTGTPTRTKLGMRYVPAVTGNRPFLDIYLKQLGTISSGSVWITIEAESGGSPSGTPLAISSKLSASNIASSYGLIRFPFPQPVSLTASTGYWIVLQGDYATSNDVNNIQWGAKSSGGTSTTYAAEFDSGSWAGVSGTTYRFYYKDYVEQHNAALTMPSGYDQSCKIGYVYNSAGNVLQPFVARNRRVIPMLDNQFINTTNAVPELTDISGIIPPVPVIVGGQFQNSTSSAVARVGGIPDGYVLSGVRDAGVAYFTAHVTNDQQLRTFITDCQACYASVSSGRITCDPDFWEW